MAILLIIIRSVKYISCIESLHKDKKVSKILINILIMMENQTDDTKKRGFTVLQ